MKFKTASDVWDTLQAGEEVERVRADNRVRITNLFNGFPLLSDEEAKRAGVEVNANFGEAPVLGQHGRRQYDNGFLTRGNFFKVTLPFAPDDKRDDWGNFISARINRVLRKSEDYIDVFEQKFASVLLHGIGPQIWYDQENWLPEYVAIEDVRVATDTQCSFKNLAWLGVRKFYTYGELVRRVWGKYPEPGWQKKPIAAILHNYKTRNWDNSTYDWLTAPDKMAEQAKQNLGYLSSDAVPTIPIWHFYWLDDDDPKSTNWKLTCIADQGVVGSRPEEFLYQSDTPIAAKRQHFIHVQYGDLNNKAPFLYHSVRSLGFLLMEPCFWTNLLRCRTLQHVFESLNVWLRSSDPVDRARAQMVQLFHKAFVPQGISIVPQTERHQIDARLVGETMEELKGLMKEASISYTQDTEPSSRRADETATAVMARVQSVNAMMSGLLNKAFRKETFSYIEICRRFCLRKSQNEDAREFQKACRQHGIPSVFVNVDQWDVAPEMPLGAGNPTMEMAESQELMGMAPLLRPEAQQEIYHERILAVTGDYRRAQRWAPMGGQQGVTSAQEHAELAFGTMMQGAPVRIRTEFAPTEQIETLLGLCAAVVDGIQKRGGQTDLKELMGLETVLTRVQELLQWISQNPNAKQQVKQYGDAMGKLQNAIRQIASAHAEMNQPANGGTDPKTQALLIQAQTKSKVSEANAQQKLGHKQQAFEQEQRRRNVQTIAEIQREGVKTAAEVQNNRLRAFSKPQTNGED